MKSKIPKYISAVFFSAGLLTAGYGASMPPSRPHTSDSARLSLTMVYHPHGIVDAGTSKSFVCAPDRNKPSDYRLLQNIRYGYTGDSIIAANSADKEQCIGIHNMIQPVLTELAFSLNGERKAKRMADKIGYCNIRYCLEIHGTATDSLQEENNLITVDILSFDCGKSDFKRCLNNIKEEEYHHMKYTPAAPEQCLVFTEDGKLIIVWYSLFHDGQETVEKVREILEFLTDDSPEHRQTSGTEEQPADNVITK